MKKVLVVTWRNTGCRTILAGFDDLTIRISVLDDKKRVESIERIQASRAWEKYPQSLTNTWSPVAMAILIMDLEKSGRHELAQEVMRVYRQTSPTRRISRLQITMGKKIMAGRKTKKLSP